MDGRVDPSDADHLVAPSNAAQEQAWDGAEGGLWAVHADLLEKVFERYDGPLLDAARANPALPRPAARARATSIIVAERSTPSTGPGAARRAAARVSEPVPHPTSRTRTPAAIRAASSSGPS